MNGFEKLHKEQDDFIKNTLQEDRIISQPIFDNFSSSMDKTKIKVKKYSYKQQKIIIFLLLLLALSICLNFYLAIVKETPTTITKIFETAKEKISLPVENNKVIESQQPNNDKEIINPPVSTPETPPSIEEDNITEVPDEQVNPVLTPNIFTEVDTNEVEKFVDQFAIGINKLDLQDTSNLESNTILLYIAQQYFSSKSNIPTSLTVDTSYASSSENFHRFLSEFTINNYLNINHLNSYTNYIGYVSRSKSYINGADYATLAKEQYKCEDVTITQKEDNLYSAKARVIRTYENEIATYEVNFTFKVNSNYKYQKYKLLSLDAEVTSSNVDTTIHLVNN
ncbi:MAG: hypothetical protein IKL55_04300 [Clostridia bacterium]|nr:hypothetical protein [Clostridia bacterium]